MSYCPARPNGQLEGWSDLEPRLDVEDTYGGDVNVQDSAEEINRLTTEFSTLSNHGTKEIVVETIDDIEKGEASGSVGQPHHLEDSLREARQNQRLIGEKKTRFCKVKNKKIMRCFI